MYNFNVYRTERIIQTIENGLVILSVTESDGGKYECFMGPTLISSYNIEIDAHRYGLKLKKIYFFVLINFDYLHMKFTGVRIRIKRTSIKKYIQIGVTNSRNIKALWKHGKKNKW